MVAQSNLWGQVCCGRSGNDGLLSARGRFSTSDLRRVPIEEEVSEYQRVRTRKGDKIDEVERSKNHNKSRVRVRVEHLFAVVKRLWGFAKVRYEGLTRNATRSFVVLGLANI